MPRKPKKPKPFNRIKAIKKASRENAGQHGRGGFHETQKDKPRVKKSVEEYLEELEEEDDVSKSSSKYVSAQDIMKLPMKERDEILARAAALAEKEYLEELEEEDQKEQ